MFLGRFSRRGGSSSFPFFLFSLLAGVRAASRRVGRDGDSPICNVGELSSPIVPTSASQNNFAPMFYVSKLSKGANFSFWTTLCFPAADLRREGSSGEVCSAAVRCKEIEIHCPARPRRTCGRGYSGDLRGEGEGRKRHHRSSSCAG